MFPSFSTKTPVQFLAFPSTNPSNLIIWGLLVATSIIFAILLLLVLASSPDTLYLDYHNKPGDLVSSTYKEIVEKLRERKESTSSSSMYISSPFAMGRHKCDAESKKATFDNSGVSFGFLISSAENSCQSSLSKIEVDFDPINAKELYLDEISRTKLHQPHQFVAYVVGFASMKDLPTTQPELPFLATILSRKRKDAAGGDKSSVIFFKEKYFTTEDADFGRGMSLFDAEEDQKHFTSTSSLKKKKCYKNDEKPTPAVFVVWIVKVTEANFNRREFSIGNAVTLEQFKVTSTTKSDDEKEHDDPSSMSSSLQKCVSPCSSSSSSSSTPSSPESTAGRFIEFVGDSITAGFCNIPSNNRQQSRNDIFETNRSSYLDEDFTRSWPWLIGEKLGARVHTTAWSGGGLVRNSRGAGKEAIRDIYRRTLISASDGKNNNNNDNIHENIWDFLSSSPKVLVINLGTNDFQKRRASEDETPVSSEKALEAEFTAEYLKLIEYYFEGVVVSSRRRISKNSETMKESDEQQPHSNHEDVGLPLLHVVLACGPMNVEMCDRVLKKRIFNAIVTESKLHHHDSHILSVKEKLHHAYVIKELELSILKFPELPKSMTHCGTHPNSLGDEKMASIGTAHLRKEMKWY